MGILRLVFIYWRDDVCRHGLLKRSMFVLPDGEREREMGLQHLVNLCHKSIFFFWTEVWRGIETHQYDESKSRIVSLSFLFYAEHENIECQMFARLPRLETNDSKSAVSRREVASCLGTLIYIGEGRVINAAQDERCWKDSFGGLWTSDGGKW